MANETQTLEVLKKILGDGVVAFHTIFAKALGSVPAGLMLSQGYFWQEKSDYKKPVTIEGKVFFTKTAKEWFDATGITEEAQKTARERLRNSNIWKESRAGMPAQTFYRIDVNALVTVIYGYLETGIPVSVDYRSKKRELTRSSNGKFRQQEAVIYGSNNIEESLESEEESLESNIPAAKKTAGKSAPNPNWSKQIATLFDEVNKSESQSLKVDFQKFNWLANPGRQFAALKKIRLALIPDLKEKQPPDQKHEPTEEEISIGFEYLFRYGFRYLAAIAESKGNGGVQFSPAIILNNYNQILQYAKQNHTTKQDRATAEYNRKWADFIREVAEEGV